MNTLNISLPEPLRTYIDHLVARGGYGTASEYVRELIRADHQRRSQDEIELMLLEGLDSEAVPLNDANRRAIRTEIRNSLKKSSSSRFTSIKAMCYHYFKTMGFENPDALYRTCEREAMRIKPETKFDKVHFTRYKTAFRNGERK